MQSIVNQLPDLANRVNSLVATYNAKQCAGGNACNPHQAPTVTVPTITVTTNNLSSVLQTIGATLTTLNQQIQSSYSAMVCVGNVGATSVSISTQTTTLVTSLNSFGTKINQMQQAFLNQQNAVNSHSCTPVFDSDGNLICWAC